MTSRTLTLALSTLSILILAACGSDGGGTGGTGGTTGTGGSATGGGGTGGTSACAKACAHVATVCPALTGCEAGCEATLATIPSGCEAKWSTFVGCIATALDVSCDSEVLSCDGALQAFYACEPGTSSGGCISQGDASLDATCAANLIPAHAATCAATPDSGCLLLASEDGTYCCP